MKHKQINLDGAVSIYATSNVPLFLLRKLQSDAAPREISSSLSSDEITDELKNSLQVKPRSLHEAVEPYVFLVALSQKKNITALKAAKYIHAPYHDWFSYLADVLEQTFSATTQTSLIVPGQMQATLPTNTSSAATRTLILTP